MQPCPLLICFPRLVLPSFLFPWHIKSFRPWFFSHRMWIFTWLLYTVFLNLLYQWFHSLIQWLEANTTSDVSTDLLIFINMHSATFHLVLTLPMNFFRQIFLFRTCSSLLVDIFPDWPIDETGLFFIYFCSLNTSYPFNRLRHLHVQPETSV